MPISCTCPADSKTVRVVMKVMMSVMISKNGDFCGGSGSSGGAVDISRCSRISI
jgi:hypothetical protein